MGEDFPQVFYAVVYKIDKVHSRFRTEKKERRKRKPSITLAHCTVSLAILSKKEKWLVLRLSNTQLGYKILLRKLNKKHLYLKGQSLPRKTL